MNVFPAALAFVTISGRASFVIIFLGAVLAFGPRTLVRSNTWQPLDVVMPFTFEVGTIGGGGWTKWLRQ